MNVIYVKQQWPNREHNYLSYIFTNDIQNILESRILTKHKLSISPSNKVSRQKALLGLNLCTFELLQRDSGPNND